jgi:cytochrome c
MKLRKLQFWAGTAGLLSVFSIVGLSFQGGAPSTGAGKELFAKRCSGCHALDSDKEGPRLRGVVGRKAGSSPGFQYSDALRKSGIVWDESLLKKWLENPQNVVKDSEMEFRVSNPEERDALVSWLKSL